MEKQSKRPLRFELVLRDKRINRKKLHVRTLSRPYTKRTHQRAHSKMCHLDMAAGQRRGVKLGISNIANYNSSLILIRVFMVSIQKSVCDIVFLALFVLGRSKHPV